MDEATNSRCGRTGTMAGQESSLSYQFRAADAEGSGANRPTIGVSSRFKEIIMCSPIPAISARERQVLEAMLKGYRSREIADALKISLKTVEYHRKALRQKTGARTTAELVLRVLSDPAQAAVATQEMNRES